MHKSLILIFILSCMSPQLAIAKECTNYEAYTAESLYPYLSSWKEIHMAYRAYGHCDDGSISEAFDEAITVLWEKRWDLITEMMNEISADTGFKQFVLKRVGTETTPITRWRVIVNSAKTKCPSEANTFCQQVIDNDPENIQPNTYKAHDCQEKKGQLSDATQEESVMCCKDRPWFRLGFKNGVRIASTPNLPTGRQAPVDIS